MKGMLWRLLVAALTAALVAGCSKHNVGDSNSSGSGAPSSNWDSLVWDQGTWQ
jgi:hypothetical protein